MTEIKFIKRAFPQSLIERESIRGKYSRYINGFTPQAIKYYDYEIEPAAEQEVSATRNSPTEKMINYDHMEGHEFEYFCADLLKKNHFENVEVTPGMRKRWIGK